MKKAIFTHALVAMESKNIFVDPLDQVKSPACRNIDQEDNHSVQKAVAHCCGFVFGLTQ